MSTDNTYYFFNKGKAHNVILIILFEILMAIFSVTNTPKGTLIFPTFFHVAKIRTDLSNAMLKSKSVVFAGFPMK